MGSNKLIDMTKPEGQQIVFQPLEAKPEKPVVEATAEGAAKPQDSGGGNSNPAAK